MLGRLVRRARQMLNQRFGLPARRVRGYPLYAQGLEDLYLHRIFAGRATGFYVDVGAHDGRFLSNTYGLYRAGWRGLCIEPNPIAYDALRRNRPGDVCLNIAIGASDVAALLRWQPGVTEGSSIGPQARGVSTYAVAARPLGRVLSEHAVPVEFDLLSVDVEGMELDVLKSLDWTGFRPRVIIVEYNTGGTARVSGLEFLCARGYLPVLVNRWNVITSRTPEQDLLAVHRRQEWYDLDRVRL